MRSRGWATLAVAGLLLVGCSGSADEGSAGTDGAGGGDDSVTSACEPGSLATLTDGELVVGSSTPFEPWYVGDQASGEGFESALVYAVAAELGFSSDQVTWETVTFEQIIAPSAKPFDFAAYQTAITPEREQGVDFSSPYLATAQGVVVAAEGDYTSITTTAELEGARIGVTATQTSRIISEDVWGDTAELVPYDDAGLAMQALSSGQLDAVVMDRFQAVAATTVYFPGTSFVGTLPSGDVVEELGFVLDLDSPLTDCVSGAVDTLAEDGTIDALHEEWLGGDDVAELG